MDRLLPDQRRNIREGLLEDGEQRAVAPTVDPTPYDDETEPSFFSKWALPVGLFLLTVFTTLWAGAYQTYQGPVRGPLNFLLAHPEGLWRGIPFAGSLLFILTTHELGHYLLSKIHRVPASLPLFIPGPPHFIGTFGAIIRMRGTAMNRRALFDIGVAGPLAGFVVAVAVLVVGLNLSTVVDRTATFGLHLGEPLLLQFMSWLVIGPVTPDSDVVLHPIAFAAWFGLFVTSLNLLPIGQLDGGHVAYALWGGRQRTMAITFVVVLVALGFVGWPGWFLWAFMAGIWGIGHPPVVDPATPLGRSRTIVGWIALAVLVVTFAPVPFSFH
jgi:membrane-associated protease RseP (regulator of RpoE activity)